MQHKQDWYEMLSKLIVAIREDVDEMPGDVKITLPRVHALLTSWTEAPSGGAESVEHDDGGNENE